MNEDQLIEAAEREMDLYRSEVARVTAQRDGAQAALARVLSWFPVTGTRNEATATRAQLAHAYRDSGLTVPDELRRFL